MAKWTFYAVDNSGKHQAFKVTAISKMEAIKKGMEKARNKAAGDIYKWDCKLSIAY